MNFHIILRLPLVAGVLAAILTSCAIPDSEFQAGISHVTNTSYPADKIAGVWIHFSHDHFGYRATGIETRTNYEFRADGTGQTQQYTKYVRSGHDVTIQANLYWEYHGSNLWTVYVPDSRQYKVLSISKGITVGYRPAYSFKVRYGNGRLYNMNIKNILVSPAEAPAYVRNQRARLQQRAAISY